MHSAHPDKHLYLPGKVILLVLWLFFTVLGLYLTPNADFFDASVAGFLLAAVCALPVAFVAGTVFQLAKVGTNALRRSCGRRGC